MIASKYLHDHAQCIHLCQVTPNCVAVNYFKSSESKKKNFCVLLNESQFDNPRLMQPFCKATYYDRIQCKDKNFNENIDNINVFEIGKENDDLINKKYNNENENKNNTNISIFTTTTTPIPQKTIESTFIKNLKYTKSFPNIIPIITPKPLSQEKLLKKLAAKVHQFNLKFVSH